MACYYNFNKDRDDQFFLHPQAVSAVPEGKMFKEIAICDLPLFTEEVLLNKIEELRTSPNRFYIPLSEDQIMSCIHALKASGKNGLPFIGPFSALSGNVKVISAVLAKGSKISSTLDKNKRDATKTNRLIKKTYDIYSGYTTGKNFEVKNPTLL